MSKLRIYELAKELGLENKALLDLCAELSIEGKRSHSNSLSDDEAEKIRRFVIRSAVSEKPDGVREVTREGRTLTERRVGGSVIRRRKKAKSATDEDESASEEASSEGGIEFPEPRELSSLAPDLAAERDARNEALERADAIFGTDEKAPPATEEVEVEEEQVIEATSAEETAEELVDEATEDAATEESEEPEAVEQEATPEDIAEEVAEPVDAVEEKKLAEANRLDDVRKRLDIRAPKVLGKIELPSKPEPKPKPKAAVETTKSKSSDDPSDSGSDVDSGRGGKSKRKKGGKDSDFDAGKKPRKKQILSKKELVDYDGEKEGWKSRRGDKKGKRRGGSSDSSADATPAREIKRVVRVDGQISVGELAKQMGMKAGEVIGCLMNLGVMASINQLVDLDTATLVTEEFGHSVQNIEQNVETMIEELTETDDPESLKLRPPVITVMGHVDHGKTSLLDAIRSTAVTDQEVGGITQHIGAHNVPVGDGSVTFLDTPGHEAFTAMRSRGAKVTDIVVLVVAADDGVMPQTIEAINHSKAAEVPIIVAVNKMDVEGANPEKVINQLSEHGLVPEEWGGDTIIVKVSAHTREGLDDLLESLHLQAEVLELKANADRRAVGTVVESQMAVGRGPVMTVLVQNGTLRKGDAFVAGAVFGKVRALTADDGTVVETAGPSFPVEILGASAAAVAGDDFVVLESEVQARKIAEERGQRRRRKSLASQSASTAVGGGPLTLERFSEMIVDSVELKELPLIVKADVQGSVEAVSDSLAELSNEEVKVKILHKAVGAISENDVQLASASGAILVAFNVRPDVRAQQLIESLGLDILYSRVIYDLVDSVNLALKGKMAPKFQEKQLGRVEVRDTFKVPKQGTIAGSYVLDGSIQRGSQVRLLRDGVVLFEGKMASLRRFKEDVKEVKTGYECGIGLEGYTDIKNGDVLEVYKIEEVAPV